MRVNRAHGKGRTAARTEQLRGRGEMTAAALVACRGVAGALAARQKYLADLARWGPAALSAVRRQRGTVTADAQSRVTLTRGDLVGVSGKFVLTAAIAALALALAGCGTGNGSRPSTVFGGYTAPVTVEGLQVTCGPDGAITAPPVASVGRDGLHVKVNDRTGSKGTHLNYTVVSSDAAPDVIRSLPVGTADLVIPEPPGGLYLSCSQGKGSKAGDDVTVLAVDVHSYYRYAALAALGCEPSLKADLGPSARGKTEQGALDALMVASKRTDMKAKLAPVGYVDAGYSSYLLERDGDPQVVATVSRDGAAYEARVVHYCT